MDYLQYSIPTVHSDQILLSRFSFGNSNKKNEDKNTTKYSQGPGQEGENQRVIHKFKVLSSPPLSPRSIGWLRSSGKRNRDYEMSEELGYMEDFELEDCGYGSDNGYLNLENHWHKSKKVRRREEEENGSQDMTVSVTFEQDMNMISEGPLTPTTGYGLSGGKAECNPHYKNIDADNANISTNGDIQPNINSNSYHHSNNNTHTNCINDNLENTQPLHILNPTLRNKSVHDRISVSGSLFFKNSHSLADQPDCQAVPKPQLQSHKHLTGTVVIIGQGLMGYSTEPKDNEIKRLDEEEREINGNHGYKIDGTVDFRNEDDKYKDRRLDILKVEDHSQNLFMLVPPEIESRTIPAISSGTSLIPYMSTNASEHFSRKPIGYQGLKNVYYDDKEKDWIETIQDDHGMDDVVMTNDGIREERGYQDEPNECRHDEVNELNKSAISNVMFQFQMGFRPTCDKCINRVPGHFSHLD